MNNASLPQQDATREQLITSLGHDSYTAYRLQHARPEHLHLTTRRCFIGPIPEGWLKDHRRDWYKHHLHIHYSSRAATFSASPDVGRHRRLSGLDGPSVTATYGHSFPQPVDTDAAEEDDEEVNEETDNSGRVSEATTEVPPAVPIPHTADASAATRFKFRVSSEEQQPKIRQVESQDSKKGLEPPLRRPRSKPSARRAQSTTSSSASFVTAQESFQTPSTTALATIDAEAYEDEEEDASKNLRPSLDQRGASFATLDASSGEPIADASSTASLVNHNKLKSAPGEVEEPMSSNVLSKLKSKAKQITSESDANNTIAAEQGQGRGAASTGVHFNIPNDPALAEQQVKIGMALKTRNTVKRMRKAKARDGQVIKVEKMLVRVDFTTYELPKDFDENVSERTECRTLNKWREYIIVCREGIDEEVEFNLQMYKTRVIPMTQKSRVKKKAIYEIPLQRELVRVNLFSSLDKTMVMWTPYKKGSIIYLMKPRSAANSMEWYTFLKNVLGWNRASALQVRVPDLDVSLMLDKPFDRLESARVLAQAARGNEEAIERTMKEEQEAARQVIQRCIGMLKDSADWHDIVDTWVKDLQIGLAWKRYDRLEWLHGANEKKMYGTIAMEKSHDLELRPKKHYPTVVQSLKDELITEPPPVEGFLVRLTSQKGTEQRFGKLFYKRLYFSSHNHYLVFTRPARAEPPPPPKLPMNSSSQIPTAQQIIEKIPLIYAVNPFPVDDGEVAWLKPGTAGTTEQRFNHDRGANDENERKINLLLHCDGSINLCNVVKVRNIHRGATPADENLESGASSDVDFDESVRDTPQEDGTTKSLDDERTFELVLRNGLILRLQAYNKTTQVEWKRRLRALVSYWKLRTAADAALYKSVRERNLTLLGIDEEAEAFMGQYAQKWEVTKSFASPELYNMCGIATCRAIHMAGQLYRKPHIHSTFARSLVLLAHGHLLVFADSVRSASGAVRPHIHHDRVAALDLRDCYVYSGLLAAGDLLYSNTTFDANHPGVRALPRVYRDDGWSSTDEDAMTAFVVWHGKRRSWFRGSNDDVRPATAATANTTAGATAHRASTSLRHLSKLGAKGRSIVFRARSRAERDHWVLGISVEIDRLAQGEQNVRLVGEDGKDA